MMFGLSWQTILGAALLLGIAFGMGDVPGPTHDSLQMAACADAGNCGR